MAMKLIILLIEIFLAKEHKEIKDKIQKNRKLDIPDSEKETLEELHIRNAKKYAKHQSKGTQFLEKNMTIFPKAIQNKINLQLKGSGLNYLEN